MVAECQVAEALDFDLATVTPFALLGPLLDLAEAQPIERALAEFLLEVSVSL
jgi:hypothetical protein